MREIPSAYNPKATEDKWYKLWESKKLFHVEPDPERKPYTIVIPPPNITGILHMGHALNDTVQDILIRWRRMEGWNAEWLPGTDHAGIATQNVVEKMLAKEGKKRQDLGREKFIERVWQWREQYGTTIISQLKRLGCSCDWDRTRFTMDEGLSDAVNEVFIRLYEKGLIYRGNYIINWCPRCQTALSDEEAQHKDLNGSLYYIKYPVKGENRHVTVATTRPETMLGDVAVAVNPTDGRYKNLVGETLILPLMNREIKVIADDIVDPEFGTGAVKITPAHDPTDYEIGLRHKLPMPSVLDADARIVGSDIAVGRYEGMSREDARGAIVAALRSQGLLVEEKPYRYAIAISERTGEVIEPLLSLQWFVKMKPLAEPALQAFRAGKVRFVPERYGRTFEQWLENIRDWNISRQIWWGHQLPVWYTPDGSVVVAESQEEARDLARKQHGTDQLTRDPDTLDTWFSSGLWPFSILGWPESTPELEHWYPSQVLVTGWEIIFLWVARMVMLGLKFMGRVPFKDVFVAPLIFDAQGRKMSKSLGNVIDPLSLVETYGADAFRMGMMRQLRLESQEVRFNEKRCEEARNFNNKIWNALRYTLALPDGLPPAMQLPDAANLTIADKWILTRLHQAVNDTGAAFDRYDFGIAAETIWPFVWYEFCDWYLEATKDPNARETRAAVLSFVLNHAMRLLHPIEPFITEEVWLALPHDGDTIVTASWPDLAEIPTDVEAAATFEALRRKVEEIRNLRAELGLAPRERLTVDVPSNVPEAASSLLATLAVADVAPVAEQGGSIAEGLLAAEARAPVKVLSERYKKEGARLRAEVERSEHKLADQRFVANAKPDVVAKEREKLASYQRELERIVTMLAEMGEAK